MFFDKEGEILDYKEDVKISECENKCERVKIEAKEESARINKLNEIDKRDMANEYFVKYELDGAGRFILQEADKLLERLNILKMKHEMSTVLTKPSDQNNEFEFLAIEADIKKIDKELKVVNLLLDRCSKFLGVTAHVTDDIYEKLEDTISIDSRSVHVSNVHCDTNKTMLQKFFCKCGTIQRITILQNKFTGEPIGIAYIQFQLQSSANKALKMDGVILNSMPLRVMPKRTIQFRSNNIRKPLVPIAYWNM